MSEYEKNYYKYAELSKKGYTSYEEFAQTAQEISIPRNENVEANAILLLGFSGNGKTTYIRNFLNEHPDYTVVSMDTISKKILGDKKVISEEDGKKIVTAFGERLKEETSKKKNIIIDGFFLNLLTRLSLSDTLHSANYNVNALDMTDIINDTLMYRVLDETSAKLGYAITLKNLEDVIKTDEYKSSVNNVWGNYLDEKQRSVIDLQKKYHFLEVGSDKYFKYGASSDELINPNPQKNK